MFWLLLFDSFGIYVQNKVTIFFMNSLYYLQSIFCNSFFVCIFFVKDFDKLLSANNNFIDVFFLLHQFQISYRNQKNYAKMLLEFWKIYAWKILRCKIIILCYLNPACEKKNHNYLNLTDLKVPEGQYLDPQLWVLLLYII